MNEDKNKTGIKWHTGRRLRSAALAVVILVVAGIAWVIYSAKQTAGTSGEMPVLVGTKRYSSAPPILIDTSLPTGWR